MSESKSQPDYPDDMRDLFEDSENEKVDESGQQSPESSTHKTNGELEQTQTKRKRSKDEANSTSLNDGNQEDMNPIRKKPRRNFDIRASLVLEKVGEKRKLSELLDNSSSNTKEIDEHDSEPLSKRTRQETNVNETISEAKGNAVSESASSDEDKVLTTLTKTRAFSALAENSLNRKVDHTGLAEKEDNSSESSDEDAEEDLSSNRTKRVRLGSDSRDESQLDEVKVQGGEMVSESESSDEDEDEAINSKPRKKGPFNEFLDVEAEVSEEDDNDEEEGEREESEDFIQTHPDDDVQLRYGGKDDARRHRALDHQREIESRIEAEKQARLIKERHQSRQTTKAKVPETISKQLLLPTVDDPQIYMVPCKEGQEKNVIMAIMKKLEEWKIQGRKSNIASAFERGTTKLLSHVYVEGRNLGDIRLFLQGIQNVYVHKINSKEIPIKEMTALFNMRPTKQLEPGAFVRTKSGLYKNDWGQIDEIDASKNEVSLKLRPRLDYTAARKKPAFRPVQRLFSAAEAKRGNPENADCKNLRSLGGNHWIYRKENYKDGFLIKKFNIKQLLVREGENPTLEVIQTFFTEGGKDGSAIMDLSAVQAAKDSTTGPGGYLVGENVEVYEGDHQGIRGKVQVSRKNEITTLAITEPKEFRGDVIDITAKSLRRAFSIGDRVNVVGGRHIDEVGMIVSVKNDQIIFMSDSHEQLTVFRNDVRVSAADGGGVPGGLGKFDMYDLVEVNAKTVGCIIKIGRDKVDLLDQNGSVISLSPSQVGNKIENKQFAATLDNNGAEIRLGDRVRDIRNHQQQVEGVVLHIRKTFLFLQNRMLHVQDSGIFVLRSTNVTITSARDGRLDKRTQGKPAAEMVVIPPFLQRNTLKENTAMGPPPAAAKPANFNNLRGAAVYIRTGAYKGLRGLITGLYDSSISVSLEANSKNIMVPYDAIGFDDKNLGDLLHGNNPRGGGYKNAPARVRRGGQEIPSITQLLGYNQQAPNANYSGGRTPAWGLLGPTSNNDNSSGGCRTPVPNYNNNNGSRTVNPYADGSKTSYGGGSQTPHWNPSSRTPVQQCSSSSSNPNIHAAFDAGFRTPAYNNNGPSTSSRIPAWMMKGPGPAR